MKYNDFSEEDFNRIQTLIGYRFSDLEILKTCFTHKTYSNVYGGSDNERLEFLGDAVLQFCVTDELYRHCGDDEGKLTELRQRFVSQTALEQACQRACLMHYLRYMGSTQNVGGKTASNLFEAVVGGIYIDGGLKEVKRFLARYLTVTQTKNFRALLQEYVQEQTKCVPCYCVEERDGTFYCIVTAMGRKAEGVGESKKIAETQAAKALYLKLTEGTKH